MFVSGAFGTQATTHTDFDGRVLERTSRDILPEGHSGPQSVDGVIFIDPNLSSDISVILNGRRVFGSSIFPVLQHVQGTPRAVKFSLPHIPSGSHILEFVHPLVTFPKFKVVVNERGAGDSATEPFYGAFSLGEYMTQVSTVPVALPLKVYPLGITDYYPSRGSFNLLGLLTQPMVLLTLVSFIIMLFVPKLQQQHLEEERLQQHMHVEQQRNQSGGRGDQVPFVETSLESATDSAFVENAMQL